MQDEVEMPDAAGTEALNVQVSNRTRANRYPQVFAAAARVAAAAGLAGGKVLSYGCSTGEEPATLAGHYFPQARIFGLDVSEEALAEARRRTAGEPRITIDRSTRESLAQHGPFDVIFAMSVLCRYPTSKRMTDLSGLFPFAQFAEQAAVLDGALRPGGILVIYNANYEFLHAPVAAGYDVVLAARIRSSGFVNKFRPDGRAAETAETSACIFRKRPAETPESAGLVVLDEGLRRLGELPRPAAATR